MSETLTVTASGRSLEEMKASVRLRMRNMVNDALGIGMDLMETKEACRHGEWMPFLKDVGISSSSAANYMRIAREVEADSKMASLPYTKILALLSAPAEEREELADAAANMSAAEIRKLTEERNKAAEAANVETARADAAEEKARRMEETLDRVAQLANERENELKAKLLEAENNRVEVEVVKVPEDYERIKAKLEAAERSARDLIDAAADAEERATAAELELEALRFESKNSSLAKTLRVAVTAFLADCQTMPGCPEQLIREQKDINWELNRIEVWIEAMRETLHGTVLPETAVVV